MCSYRSHLWPHLLQTSLSVVQVRVGTNINKADNMRGN